MVGVKMALQPAVRQATGHSASLFMGRVPRCPSTSPPTPRAHTVTGRHTRRAEQPTTRWSRTPLGLKTTGSMRASNIRRRTSAYPSNRVGPPGSALPVALRGKGGRKKGWYIKKKKKKNASAVHIAGHSPSSAVSYMPMPVRMVVSPRSLPSHSPLVSPNQLGPFAESPHGYICVYTCIHGGKQRG